MGKKDKLISETLSDMNERVKGFKIVDGSKVKNKFDLENVANLEQPDQVNKNFYFRSLTNDHIITVIKALNKPYAVDIYNEFRDFSWWIADFKVESQEEYDSSHYSSIDENKPPKPYITDPFPSDSDPIEPDSNPIEPTHYGGQNNPLEVIKLIDSYGLGFSLGNAVKYILRAGKKYPSKKKEDLKKAVWYLEYVIEGL